MHYLLLCDILYNGNFAKYILYIFNVLAVEVSAFMVSLVDHSLLACVARLKVMQC